MKAIDYRQADCKTQIAICKSTRRVMVCLSNNGEIHCKSFDCCLINRAVCAVHGESIRRTKEWLANYCNAIKPTIKDKEMGIL